ncbi:MAG: hypothetical protein V1701_03865 [Planctomycetota bacterium]
MFWELFKERDAYPPQKTQNFHHEDSNGLAIPKGGTKKIFLATDYTELFTAECAKDAKKRTDVINRINRIIIHHEEKKELLDTDSTDNTDLVGQFCVLDEAHLKSELFRGLCLRSQGQLRCASAI